MTAENGVANVIRGVLDMGGGDSEDNMDWQKVRYRYRRGGNSFECEHGLFFLTKLFFLLRLLMFVCLSFAVVNALETFFWYYSGSNKLEIKI